MGSVALPRDLLGKRQSLRSALPTPLTAPDPVLRRATTAYRVLMVWVYDRTGGSLLVAMLMHTSLTASTLFILMPPVRGVSLDLLPRIGCRAVGRRCSGRRGPRRASLASTAPEVGGLRKE